MNLLTLSTRSDFDLKKKKKARQFLLHYDPKCPIKVNNKGHSEKKTTKTETGLKRKKTITLEVIEAKEGIIAYILFH